MPGSLPMQYSRGSEVIRNWIFGEKMEAEMLIEECVRRNSKKLSIGTIRMSHSSGNRNQQSILGW